MYKLKIFILCAVLIISVNAFNTPERLAAKKAEKAPDFSLVNVLDGKVHRLSRLVKPKNIIILNFFNTTTPPCLDEIPHFVKLSKKYKKTNVLFIGILIEKKHIPLNEKKFIKNYKIGYPVLTGTLKVVKDYGGVRGMPKTFIINEKREIIAKHTGYIDKNNLEELIEESIGLRDK